MKHMFSETELALIELKKKKITKLVSELTSISREDSLFLLKELHHNHSEKRYPDVLEDAKDSIPWFVNTIGQGEIERFAFIFLNNSKKIVHKCVFDQGSTSRTTLYPRQVFAVAFKYGANAIICAHNHPSGVKHPSPQDRELTRRMADIGNSVEVNLVASYVVTASGEYTEIYH